MAQSTLTTESADQSDSDAVPDEDYELADNVAVDLVKYVRSNTIRNEQQFLLLALAYASGLFEDTHDYVSSVAIGTSSSGKTHLKDKVDKIYTELEVMDASTGSDKVLIYSDDWDDADVISMGELQQPSEEMLEFMKRAHGGDEEVVIRTTRGNPSEGFEEKVIRKEAKSYHFTFAQFEADFEFWNRLLTVPVHESESKNRAVGRMKAGYENIQIGDEDVEYGYPFPAGTQAIQAHMGDVKREAPKRVVLPTEDTHEWGVWEILEPIFNHGRSESNRIYSMVFNLVKASALVNYHARERTTIEVEDAGQVTERDALVAAPQDVANIARCLGALRATTHEIDRKKRALVEAIRTKSGPGGVIEGIEPIREFLSEADAPEIKKGELEAHLENLQENFLIDIAYDAGEGGKNAYRAFKWDQLGQPRIMEHADLFEGCTDPLSGEPFLDVWEQERSEMETTAQDLLKSAGSDGPSRIRSRSSSSTSSGGASSSGGLGDFGGGAPDTGPELDAWVETIRDRIAPVLDGTRITNMADVPIEAFLGLVPISNPDVAGVDPSGSMLDPTHDVWDQPDQPSTWVETETEARRKIQDAIDECIAEGVITFEAVHETDESGSPVDATLAVETGDE